MAIWKNFWYYKNPSHDEFIKFAREVNFLEFNPLKNLMLRFIIDTSNGDLYIWDGQHALHRDLFKILKLKTKSYIGGVLTILVKLYIMTRIVIVLNLTTNHNW